jgi:hypothetical protein
VNPDYLWLTSAIELLAFFVAGPALALAIAYAAWRGKPTIFNPKRSGMTCIASGVTAVPLFGFVKWMNADVKTPQYFLQFACFLISGLLFGVYMGSGFSVLLRLWRWHKATRLSDSGRTGR